MASRKQHQERSKAEKRSAPPGSLSADPPWAGWLAAALLALAILTAYQNSFSGQFFLDDVQSIQENQTIRHLWPIDRVLTPPGGAITVSGRPLLNLSLALNYALGGTNPWGYHAVNLAVHFFASLALFGIARRTLLQPRLRPRFEKTAWPLGLAVALLWAVHPLQTESVTYVVQRAESLMGLFYLFTLYCFIRAVPLGISDFKFQISNPWFVLCIAACLLGMGTKEVMVSAPLMVLLYDRTFVAGSFATALRERWGLYAGLAATWLVLAWNVGGQKADINATVSAASYALTQCWALSHYLWLSVWPHWLLFDYGTLLVTNPTRVIPSVLAVLLLAGATAFCLWRRPAPGFLGCWFFLILAPTSSVMPLAGQTVAEHRMYLPLAAVTALAVFGFHFLFACLGARAGRGEADSPRAIGQIEKGVFLFAILALVFVTIKRNQDYRSHVALWSDTAAKYPSNSFAHHDLGMALIEAKQLDRAISEFQKSLEIAPDSSMAHNSLGLALIQKNLTDEAISHFRRALQIRPGYAQAHANLANALLQRGQTTEALAHLIEVLNLQPNDARAYSDLGNAQLQMGRADEAARCYKKALDLQPDLVEARVNLADVLLEKNRVGDAIDQLNRAIEIQPTNASAHFNLGNAMLKLGRADAAIASYQNALALQPNMASAHNNLGATLFAQGRLADAVAQWNESSRLQPDNPDTQNNLAWVLATCADPSVRNGTTAVRLASRAVELTGGANPVFLGTLAAAYAEAGQMTQAVETAQRALDLTRSQTNGPLFKALETQINLHKAGLPFHGASQSRVTE